MVIIKVKGTVMANPNQLDDIYSYLGDWPLGNAQWELS